MDLLKIRQIQKSALFQNAKAYILALIVALLIAAFIRTALLESFRVPTNTMIPNLKPGDIIFVKKWVYGARIPYFLNWKFTQGRSPQIGDIVTFTASDGVTHSIKRVVGLSEDRVGLIQGETQVNGSPSRFNLTGDPANICGTESHPSGKEYSICKGTGKPENVYPVLVPKGSLFVVSDFREATDSDAKRWDIVRIADLEGEAGWIWFSMEPVGGLLPQFRWKRFFQKIN